MKKPLLSVVGAFLCAGAISFTASASDLSGYFRVQNVGTGNYVEVTGPLSAAPDKTWEQASTNAATVIYVDADWAEKNGKMMLRLNSLRGQGVEVIGEPIEDYLGAMLDVLGNADSAGLNDIMSSLLTTCYQNGYTSVGRALVQTMIWIVAQRLDGGDLSSDEGEELAAFAERFNEEVAAKIDLGIYLEPVGDNYRVVFISPNLKPVSDWYLYTDEDGNQPNKATFEKGFDAMRTYMNAKIGFTGEGLDEAEIAEMKSWGYDPTEKHHEIVDDYLLYVRYEEIFADPDLLFNWLKLNVIKLTDPNRCPDIEIQGISMKGLADALHENEFAAQLISYFPKFQQDQPIYLTDGKNEVYGKFDFTSEEGALALDKYSQWNICDIETTPDNYLYFEAKAQDMYGKYASVYTDFPMKAVNDKTLFWVLAEKAETVVNEDGRTYKYHPLEQVATVKRQQPVLIEMGPDPSTNPSNHPILPDYDSKRATAPALKTPTFAFQSPGATIYVDNTTFKGVTLNKEADINIESVTFSSSNEDVAQVAEDGTVTVKGAGTTDITATFDGNAKYTSATATYTLTVNKHDKPDFKFTAGVLVLYIDGEVHEESEVDKVDLEMSSGITLDDVVFWSTVEDVATVDGKGNLTLVGEGTTEIKAKFKGNWKYNGEVTVSYTLIVDKYNAEFHYAETNVIVKLDKLESFEMPELVIADEINVENVSFAAQDPDGNDSDVATVDAEGNVTLTGKTGSVIIVATFDGDETYKDVKAECAIMVVDNYFSVNEEEVANQYSIDREIVLYEEDGDIVEDNGEGEGENEGETEESSEEIHDQSGSVFRGVFFATVANKDVMLDHGIDLDNEEGRFTTADNPKVHLIRTETINNREVVWYGMIDTDEPVPANTAFLLRPTGNTENVSSDTSTADVEGYPVRNNILVEDSLVGVTDVTTDESEMKPGRFYDLRGIEVTEPVSGNIYIFNGKKVYLY